ncbi:MAG: hypothetical protein EBZ67_15120, partial [Chitinophagia bacterium]|nr:hypothetical protein [Chitinophagia bacterium]
TQPRETIVSAKRFIGRAHDDPETRRMGPYAFVSPKPGEANIVRFDADGSPSKAVGTIVLTQFPNRPGSTNPTSGGLSPEMAETMIEGDSLAHIAYRTYDSAMRWRDVAAFNGIDDPLRTRVGQRLRLPSPAELPQRTEGGVTVPELDEPMETLELEEVY